MPRREPAPEPEHDPERDGDALEGELAELGGGRRIDWAPYLRRLVGTFLVLVLGVGALNLIADPQGEWGLHVFPVDARDSRAVKLQMAGHASGYDTLVIGSSRSEHVSSAMVQKLAGRNAFNGGIDAASTGDMRDMWNTAKAHDGSALRHLIVVLDAESFRKPVPDRSIGQRVRSLFSLSEAHNSAGRLLTEIGLGGAAQKLFPHDNTLFAPPKLGSDGHEVSRPGFDFAAARRRGGPAAGWDSAATLQGFYDDWGTIAGTDGARRFEALVHDANARGVTPVIVLPPYYPGFLRLSGARWTAEHARVLEYLRGLSGGLRFDLADASSPHSFGGNPADFSDNVHYGDPDLWRMLRFVENKVGRSAL